MSEEWNETVRRFDQIDAGIAELRALLAGGKRDGAPSPIPALRQAAAIELTEHHHKAAELYGCSLTNKSTLLAVARHGATLNGVPSHEDLRRLAEMLPADLRCESSELHKFLDCEVDEGRGFLYFLVKAGHLQKDPENKFKYVKKEKNSPVLCTVSVLSETAEGSLGGTPPNLNRVGDSII